MLNWRIEKIRYAPDKMTLFIFYPDDPFHPKDEIHITFEVYNGQLTAVARIGEDVVWYSKILHKPFVPP